jgi:hypothetical protein
MLGAIRTWEPEYNEIGVAVFWAGTKTGGDLFIDQWEQTLTLGTQVPSRRRPLPGYEAFTDDNGFIPKRIEPLGRLGAGIYELVSQYRA